MTKQEEAYEILGYDSPETFEDAVEVLQECGFSAADAVIYSEEWFKGIYGGA